MQTDSQKRFYILLFAVFINIVPYYLLLVKNSIAAGSYGADVFIWPAINDLIFFLFLSIISTIPVLLSVINFKQSYYFIYGVPFLWILYDSFNSFVCINEPCYSQVAAAFGGGSILFYIILKYIFVFAVFLIFYKLGLYLKNANSKIILSLLLIEAVLLLGCGLFFGYQSQINAESKVKLTLLQEKNPDNYPLAAEVVKTCESFLNNDLKKECWKRGVEMYPNVDICSWSKEVRGSDKKGFYEFNEFGCLYQESEFSNKVCVGEKSWFDWTRDPIKNTQVTQCFWDMIKIYPKLDFCTLGTGSNDWEKNCLNNPSENLPGGAYNNTHHPSPALK